LALARGIPEADRLFRQGKEVYGRFSNQEAFLIAGSDVGFIGFGNLGRALIKLLEPFRCRVRVYDPWLANRWLAEFGMTPSSLDNVLATSRILFVLAGATAENQAMIGKRELDRMPKGACLVLVSRGSLVDFDVLTAKVRHGDIRAALDVFPQEPFPKTHPCVDSTTSSCLPIAPGACRPPTDSWVRCWWTIWRRSSAACRRSDFSGPSGRPSPACAACR